MNYLYKSIIMYVLTAVSLVILYSVLMNGYISSPGFTTQEAAQEFAANMPTCYGYSYLMNAEEVAADAPGASICFGYLAR